MSLIFNWRACSRITTLPTIVLKMDSINEYPSEIMEQDYQTGKKLISGFECLPTEILVKILNYLPLNFVVNICPEVGPKWEKCVEQRFLVPHLKRIARLDPILEKTINANFSLYQLHNPYKTYKKMTICKRK